MILYVYAVTREAVTPDAEAVDGSRRFGAVHAGAICAVFTPVDAEAFSQEVIDRRAGDLEWLGAIGYRHQEVVSALMKQTTLVPLRAFTLFSSEEALRTYLAENAEALEKTLQRLDGKQEWTLRIELEPSKWSDALTTRVASLREMQNDIATSAPGKAFLLRKKLDDEKKRASRIAEEELVSEIERAVLTKLQCETIAETRARREGAFPQINVLLNRDEETVLQELLNELASRYESDGVTLGVTGPWPPYTFAGATDNGQRTTDNQHRQPPTDNRQPAQ
ncbi:MAG: GvpL/GvpF family gas vesicle protein [Acidobacteriota bacterium]|nr:GvpL/GvpF family gas vesicle protein [Acidobacteriota bacterium]